MRHLRFVALSLWASALGAACHERAPGKIDQDGNRSAGPLGRSIETLASPLSVVAGGSTTVSCVVRRGETYLPDEPTEVVAVPAAATATKSSGQWTLTFTDIGEHALNCRTTDGGLSSPSDVHVEVTPAAASSIDTALSAGSVLAGLPVAASCFVYDTYGNLDEEARASSLDAPVAIRVDPHTTADFVVRGSVAGAYPVACRLDNLVDTTPATLNVVAGIPGHSITSVDQSDVTPTETVNVGCQVTDLYGNPLSGWPTAVQVLAADGSAPAAAGVSLTPNTFSATRAGVYYVFCTVPGQQAGDESPAVVTVRPGGACTWAYTDFPAGDCFWQGHRLPFDFVAWDFWGNEITGATTNLVAVPSTGVQADGGGWRFTQEGDFDLTLSVSPPLDMDGAHDCAAAPGSVFAPYIANIRVDSSGPQFVISSPSRAAMLTTGGVADLPLSVTGTVSDTLSPIIALDLDGSALPVSGSNLNEPLNVSQQSRWGLNVIAGSATDECSNRTVLAQSYLRSGQYFNPSLAPDPGSRATTGILAHMNQPVIDDGNRADLDDLASLGAAVLASQDFNALMPAGSLLAHEDLTGSCSGCFAGRADTGYDVWRHPDAGRMIAWGGPYIDSLQAVNGGLSFSIRIESFAFPLRMTLREKVCTCVFCICGSGTNSNTVDAWAGADRITATGTMAISLAGGVPQVSVPAMSLNTSGLYFNPDCGWAQFICDLFTGLVVDLLQQQIEDALANAIGDALPSIVGDFLSSFSLNTSFTVPPPMNATLTLASGLDRVVFSGPPGAGWGELGLFSQVYPSARGANIPLGSLGAIRKDGALPVFSSSPYSFGMGLEDDMFNQILWALWYGGALDLPDVTQLLGTGGVPGVSMSFFANLPPVVMPGRSANQIDIGLGDVYVDASVDLGQLLGGSPGTTINVGLYLSMIAGASIDITPTNELLVNVDPNAQIATQVVSIDDPGYQGLMSDLFTELLGIVAPNLIASVFSAFPIPEFDLSGVGGLPPGTVWKLGNADMDRTPDYYRLTGSLQ